MLSWRRATPVASERAPGHREFRPTGGRQTGSSVSIEWADIILVMEQGYQSHIMEKYRDYNLPRIENLNIPDEYEYMDNELIEMIKASVEFIIKNHG